MIRGNIRRIWVFDFRKKAATAYSVTISRTLVSWAPVRRFAILVRHRGPPDQSPWLPQQLYSLHVDKSDPHHHRSRRPFRYATRTRDHNITILYIYLNVYILVTIYIVCIIYIYSTRPTVPFLRTGPSRTDRLPFKVIYKCIIAQRRIATRH